MKWELLAITGFVAVLTGCWWLHPSLAMVVGGSSACGLAAIGYLRNRPDGSGE